MYIKQCGLVYNMCCTLQWPCTLLSHSAAAAATHTLYTQQGQLVLTSDNHDTCRKFKSPELRWCTQHTGSLHKTPMSHT